MSKLKMTYFDKEDILHLNISDENETNSIEISPNVTAELNEDGEVIGLEILKASTFIRDSFMDMAQAKILNFRGKNKTDNIDIPSKL
ncbi:MAG: DUF2283 domain-containing protein [Candidatus Lokiarchaeota archaeon]|mgnify:CR=1 FL=1|nr:DUF2283 domain-containing protein [Candidatus Lokiarchaeota archaeon]